MYNIRCYVSESYWWRVDCFLNFSQKLASHGNYYIVEWRINSYCTIRSILHVDKKRNEILWNTWNKMQEAYPGVLGGHEGHTTKSCCPLRFTLVISRKSEKSMQILHFLCPSFTDAVPSTIITRHCVLHWTLAKYLQYGLSNGKHR